MSLQSYIVTDTAGPRVNGERVVAGQTVRMTAKQAQFYLDQREVVPATVAAASPAAAPAKPKR